jgi:hypothetical protein
MQLSREHGDRAEPERPGANRHAGWIGDQLGHKGGIAALALGRAGCGGDEERHFFEPSRQVVEPAQGGGIRPVKVVDREQRRLLKGHVGGEPVETVEDRKGAFCRRVLRRGVVGGAEERFHERGRPGEQLRAEVGRDGC